MESYCIHGGGRLHALPPASTLPPLRPALGSACLWVQPPPSRNCIAEQTMAAGGGVAFVVVGGRMAAVCSDGQRACGSGVGRQVMPGLPFQEKGRRRRKDKARRSRHASTKTKTKLRKNQGVPIHQSKLFSHLIPYQTRHSTRLENNMVHFPPFLSSLPTLHHLLPDKVVCEDGAPYPQVKHAHQHNHKSTQHSASLPPCLPPPHHFSLYKCV